MSHFKYIEVTLGSGRKWMVAQALLDVTNELYAKAVSQATAKSRYTMRFSQAGKERSPSLKFQRQFMGTLAEIYAQEYLKETFSELGKTDDWNIIRYDDVRTDEFKSPENEYDIMIIAADKKSRFTVESRSSIAYDRSLAKAIEQYDIIGRYSSTAKKAERYSDYYIRPLYEFIPFDREEYDELKFREYLEAGKLDLYIVGGCTGKQMKEKGYTKNMRQGATTYRVVKLTDAFDAVAFKKREG